MKNWRANLIFSLLILFSGAIFGRLIFLQIIKFELYSALAEGQQKIVVTATGIRGEVFFKDGEVLATNKTSRYVYACPNEIKQKEETAAILAEILNLDENTVFQTISQPGLFESLKRQISPEEETALLSRDLTGVYLKEEIIRFYPQKESAGHLIGFLGGEGIGQYGLEGYYDEILKGEEIISQKERGPFGYFSSSPASDLEQALGANLYLTVDYNLQYQAEKLLKEAQTKLDFSAGQIIVMEPQTGKILALAQVPLFDPNQYGKVKDAALFQNGAIQKIYEPGSVFKPITMAGGLNEEKISPQTVYTDSGLVNIGGWPIENYDGRTWGQQTMTGVLERSINTGAVFAQQQLGNKLFLQYIEDFGFFEKTGLDLQGEVSSQNQEFKKGYEVNFATAAFGQGIEITPIQLIRAFAAIANGGRLVRPYVVEKIVKNDEIIKVAPNEEPKQVISQKTASQLTAMLVSVTENGFGKSARINGYFIAGKTGTSQMPWPSLGINRSGYSAKTWQSFIGFAPAFDPQFVILVKLDDPQAGTAEYSALPIFREMAKYIIDLWQIPPDHKIQP